jgi:hypothetical protein
MVRTSDTAANSGSISGGWSLTITTVDPIAPSAISDLTPVADPVQTVKAAKLEIEYSHVSGGSVTLRINGTDGATYSIQASEDLASWIELGKVSGGPDLNTLTDNSAEGYHHRFYRAVGNEPVATETVAPAAETK